jgi:2-hydroxy-6-oxonona-2,4-dienedioate hydrolase
MALTDEGLIDIPGLLSRRVRLASGATAHYVTAGSSGPEVVLLHGGLPGSSGVAGWRFMAPFLAANGFRVYCPDMPAFGLSDPAPQYRPRGLYDHVDFVQEFVTALCLDRFYLAGNSMGCMNTVAYTTAHPERVLRFVLIAGSIGDITEDAPRFPGTVRIDPFDGTAASMRALMESIIRNKGEISDALIDMRVASANVHREAHAALWPSIMEFGGQKPYRDPNVAARMSTRGRFDRLTIPGLYLYGKEDVLSPVENGYEQEDRLPNVQFFYPEDTGHQGQTDQPDLFNQVFLEFFRDGSVTRRTADSAGISKRRPELAQLVAQA